MPTYKVRTPLGEEFEYQSDVELSYEELDKRVGADAARTAAARITSQSQRGTPLRQQLQQEEYARSAERTTRGARASDSGVLGTFAGGVGRGAAGTTAAAISGLGAIEDLFREGTDPGWLRQYAQDIRDVSDVVYPSDYGLPDWLRKGAEFSGEAVGSSLPFFVAAPAGAAAGAARLAPYALAGLSGFGSEYEQAREAGATGWRPYAQALAGGLAEGLTERYLGKFGGLLKPELRGVVPSPLELGRRIAGEGVLPAFGRGVRGEALEELVAGAATDVTGGLLTDPSRLDPQRFAEARALDALGGAIGGAAPAGVRGYYERRTPGGVEARRAQFVPPQAPVAPLVTPGGLPLRPASGQVAFPEVLGGGGMSFALDQELAEQAKQQEDANQLANLIAEGRITAEQARTIATNQQAARQVRAGQQFEQNLGRSLGMSLAMEEAEAQRQLDVEEAARVAAYDAETARLMAAGRERSADEKIAEQLRRAAALERAQQTVAAREAAQPRPGVPTGPTPLLPAGPSQFVDSPLIALRTQRMQATADPSGLLQRARAIALRQGGPIQSEAAPRPVVTAPQLILPAPRGTVRLAEEGGERGGQAQEGQEVQQVQPLKKGGRKLRGKASTGRGAPLVGGRRGTAAPASTAAAPGPTTVTTAAPQLVVAPAPAPKKRKTKAAAPVAIAPAAPPSAPPPPKETRPKGPRKTITKPSDAKGSVAPAAPVSTQQGVAPQTTPAGPVQTGVARGKGPGQVGGLSRAEGSATATQRAALRNLGYPPVALAEMSELAATGIIGTKTRYKGPVRPMGFELRERGPTAPTTSRPPTAAEKAEAEAEEKKRAAAASPTAMRLRRLRGAESTGMSEAAVTSPRETSVPRELEGAPPITEATTTSQPVAGRPEVEGRVVAQIRGSKELEAYLASPEGQALPQDVQNALRTLLNQPGVRRVMDELGIRLQLSDRPVGEGGSPAFFSRLARVVDVAINLKESGNTAHEFLHALSRAVLSPAEWAALDKERRKQAAKAARKEKDPEVKTLLTDMANGEMSNAEFAERLNELPDASKQRAVEVAYPLSNASEYVAIAGNKMFGGEAGPKAKSWAEKLKEFGRRVLDAVRGVSGPSFRDQVAKELLEGNWVIQQMTGSSTADVANAPPVVTQDEDAAYMAAVESGDTAEAQRLVIEAAKSAGYTMGPVYHGSASPEFRQFRNQMSGIWFALHPEGASPGSGDTVQSTVTAMLNPGTLYKLTPEQVEQFRFSPTPLAFTRRLREGARFPDSVQVGEYAVVVFDPKRVKSAAPVTRDRQGNVIPISERFNPATADINFAPPVVAETEEGGSQPPVRRGAREARLPTPGYLPKYRTAAARNPDGTHSWFALNDTTREVIRSKARYNTPEQALDAARPLTKGNHKVQVKGIPSKSWMDRLMGPEFSGYEWTLFTPDGKELAKGESWSYQEALVDANREWVVQAANREATPTIESSEDIEGAPPVFRSAGQVQETEAAAAGDVPQQQGIRREAEAQAGLFDPNSVAPVEALILHQDTEAEREAARLLRQVYNYMRVSTNPQPLAGLSGDEQGRAGFRINEVDSWMHRYRSILEQKLAKATNEFQEATLDLPNLGIAQLQQRYYEGEANQLVDGYSKYLEAIAATAPPNVRAQAASALLRARQQANRQIVPPAAVGQALQLIVDNPAITAPTGASNADVLAEVQAALMSGALNLPNPVVADWMINGIGQLNPGLMRMPNLARFIQSQRALKARQQQAGAAKLSFEQAFALGGPSGTSATPTKVSLRAMARRYAKQMNKAADERDAARGISGRFRRASARMEGIEQALTAVEEAMATPTYQAATAAAQEVNPVMTVGGMTKDQQGQFMVKGPITDNRFTISMQPTAAREAQDFQTIKAALTEIEQFLADPNVDPRKKAEFAEIRQQLLLLGDQTLGTKFQNRLGWTFKPAWAKSPRNLAQAIGGRMTDGLKSALLLIDSVGDRLNQMTEHPVYGDVAITKKAEAAIKAHGLDPSNPAQVMRYEEDILNPIFASAQSLGQVRLNQVGAKLPDGTEVKREDLALADALHAHDQHLRQIAEENALKRGRTAEVADVTAGRQVVRRGAVATGPLTSPRTAAHWTFDFVPLWRSMDPAQRNALLDDAEWFRRLVLGRISETNPDFTRQFDTTKFGTRTTADLARALKAGTVTIDTVEDAAAYFYTGPPLSAADAKRMVANFRAALVDDITATAEAFGSQVLNVFETKLAREMPKALTESLGAEGSFLRARGKMLAPSTWYDYTRLTPVDRTRLRANVKNITRARALAQFDMVEDVLARYVRELEQEVLKTAKAGGSEKAARKAISEQTKRGERRFDLAEAQSVLTQIGKVRKAMAEAAGTQSSGYDKGAAEAVGHLNSAVATGLLTRVTTQGLNATSGAYFAPALMDAQLRGLWGLVTSPLRSTWRLGEVSAIGALRKLGQKNPAFGAWLKSPNGSSFQQAIASRVDRYSRAVGALEDEGIIDEGGPMDQLRRWGGEAATALSGLPGGRLESGESMREGPVMRRLLRLQRRFERGVVRPLGRATTGTVDSLINIANAYYLDSLMEPLETAVTRLTGSGRTPGLDDPVTAKDTGMDRPSFNRLNGLLRPFGGVTGLVADAMARRAQDPEADLIGDDVLDLLTRQMAQQVNVLRETGRPQLFQRGTLGRVFGTFSSYGLNLLEKVLEVRQGPVDQTKSEALMQNVKFSLLLTVAAALGVAGLEGLRELEELFSGKTASGKRLENILREPTAQDAALYLIGAAGTMIPYLNRVGSAVARQDGNFTDLSSMVPLLSVLGDATKTLRTAVKTGDVALPVMDFMQRVFAPVAYAANAASKMGWLPPGLQGDIERASAQRALRAATPAGIEMREFKPSGGITATKMTMLGRRLLNAASAGDGQTMAQALREMQRFYIEDRKMSPEDATKAVRSYVGGLEPEGRVYGRKLSDPERAQIVHGMTEEQRAAYDEGSRGFAATDAMLDSLLPAPGNTRSTSVLGASPASRLRRRLRSSSPSATLRRRLRSSLRSGRRSSGGRASGGGLGGRRRLAGARGRISTRRSRAGASRGGSRTARRLRSTPESALGLPALPDLGLAA